MNCHSQIWTSSPELSAVRHSYFADEPIRWQRVNRLPDFVFFNHSAHVSHGVGCVTCHGQVDKMPLMYQAQSLLMEWCLDCHRAPEKYLRPREDVFNMGYEPPRSDRPVVARIGAEAREFTDQLELGRFLKAAYGVSSIQHMTSCSICHR